MISGNPSKLLVILILLAAAAPPAWGKQVIINGHQIALEQRLLPGEHGTSAPLEELAGYLGAEVVQGGREVLLRWGAGEETPLRLEKLQFRDGLAYISLTELAELLGARLLEFDDSLYLFAPQSELRSLSYSYLGGAVRLRFTRLAPLEMERAGRKVKLLFHNSALGIAPRTGRFPHGPVERLELYPEEPDRVVLKVRLRRAAVPGVSTGFVNGEYAVELKFNSDRGGSPVQRLADSTTSQSLGTRKLSGKVQLTPWVSYYREEQRTAAGKVRIDYLLVNGYRVHYRLRTALSEEGLGTLGRLETMVKSLGGAAGINGNFFDPDTNLPIGLVIKDGEVLSPPYGRRAALGIDLFGRVVIFNQGSPPFLPLRDAVSAGPLLLKDGKVSIDHRAEGFDPDFVNRRAARSAVGITPEGDLLMLVAARDGSSVGMNLKELARLLLELGAADALALDGGSSASLVVRQGFSLRSIGNRRIAVGLILVPK